MQAFLSPKKATLAGQRKHVIMRSIQSLGQSFARLMTFRGESGGVRWCPTPKNEARGHTKGKKRRMVWWIDRMTSWSSPANGKNLLVKPRIPPQPRAWFPSLFNTHKGGVIFARDEFYKKLYNGIILQVVSMVEGAQNNPRPRLRVFSFSGQMNKPTCDGKKLAWFLICITSMQTPPWICTGDAMYQKNWLWKHQQCPPPPFIEPFPLFLSNLFSWCCTPSQCALFQKKEKQIKPCLAWIHVSGVFSFFVLFMGSGFSFSQIWTGTRRRECNLLSTRFFSMSD